ncbi:MAG TPA: hypothetical protein VFU63_02870 [Ktedonobacterales bacterium]|nr:hypothetical protein [Ktedonobacterales bacterium]
MKRHRGHGQDRSDKPDETGRIDQTSRLDGCAAFGPLLEAFYHHALEPERAQTVADHVGGCALCGAALEHLAATDRLIAAAPTARPGPELRERLAARIAAAGAYRSAETAASVSSKEVSIVNNTSDSGWTKPDPQMTHSKSHWQRMGVWIGSVAAVLVVALLAGSFVTRAPNQTSTGHGGLASSSAACTAGNIKAQLSASDFLYDLNMVSPSEGWAVGSILDESHGPANTLILHFKNCAWTPVTTNYPAMALMGVSMDSATDGWAVGGGPGGNPLALHYTDGTWQQAKLPGENTLTGAYTLVRMRTTDDGWIVLTHSKDQYGLLSEGLLHLVNGKWSAVSAPFTIIDDVLPVGPNEAWIAGYVSGGQQTPVLYHYQAGNWTSVSLPSGVALDQLRMVAPNDIWGSGHISAASGADNDQRAAVLHYDGSEWQQVNIGAKGHPQFVQAFDRNTNWAFTLTGSLSPIDIISSTQYEHGGTWQSVAWPFKNMGLGFVSTGMNPIQRVSPDEYWTIGWSDVTWNPDNGTGSHPVTVLLYFTDGAWHEIPSR